MKIGKILEPFGYILVIMIVVLFCFFTGVKSDFERFEHEGLPFILGEYQERGLTDEAIIGSFKKVNDTIYDMYLAGIKDTRLKIVKKNIKEEIVCLEDGWQKYTLYFNKGKFKMLTQQIYEKIEYGIKPVLLYFKQ